MADQGWYPAKIPSPGRPRGCPNLGRPLFRPFLRLFSGGFSQSKYPTFKYTTKTNSKNRKKEKKIEDFAHYYFWRVSIEGSTCKYDDDDIDDKMDDLMKRMSKLTEDDSSFDDDDDDNDDRMLGSTGLPGEITSNDMKM